MTASSQGHTQTFRSENVIKKIIQTFNQKFSIMEFIVTIQEVGAYSERQYNRQDGTTEYFKSRGMVMKHGGDVVYGEMTGELASKNRDTQYYQNQLYVVKGFWKHRTWGDNNDRHENAFYITDLQVIWV